jgi:hypothetical protein
MKNCKMLALLTLVLAFAFVASVPLAGAADDAKSVKATEAPPTSYFVAKEKEVWEALKQKDKATASRLLADDFVGMYATGFYTKSEWVKQIDEQYSITDYTIDDVKLLRASPTTALLLYKSTCKGTGEWAEFCARAEYISDLWVKRNGRWMAMFSQDTQATSSQSGS